MTSFSITINNLENSFLTIYNNQPMVKENDELAEVTFLNL